MDELTGIGIRQLSYFAEVAEAGTVTAAAEQLHIAQPSLSQQIRALERRVGTPLFHRRPQGMELTDSGRVLLEGVQRAFAELTSAVAAARGLPRQALVGVCSGVPETVLRSAEAALHEHGPLHLSLERVSSQGQVGLLRRGDLAFGLLRLPVDRTALTVRVISDEPLGVVVGSAHRLAARTALTWDDLADQQLLWFPAGRAPGYASQVLAQLAEHGWSPVLVSVDHSSHTLFRHTLSGRSDLVALRPRHAVADDPGLAWRPVGPRAPRERLALTALRDGPWAQRIG
ncbi:LysR family transcriptional regulator [Streptomyces sp. 769]|uniref:LysR family transcriptional regulator n=1 Tax=Streptomyces sp. 769 TaxID=1262452 RepID=UPI00057D7E9C|nr:LysR family transcriptional regulator [Streptomyces sp. 769]AJC54233.1 HTH-type transcriptional regulator BudR [Streptomyces sp. 769]